MSEAWEKLLSSRRIGGSTNGSRPPFTIDHDRIVFSSAFRRLQDKTQVFPLSTSDYTRTRLTHSIEVSTVGKSFSSFLGKALKDRNVSVPGDLPDLLAAACLAHDIGNPPFGHAGESAIQAAAKPYVASQNLSGAEAMDLLKFEGNAQGFRVLTRLQMRDREGAMQPTAALVGAMAKYPRPSKLDGREPKEKYVPEKKFNFFQSDASAFNQFFDLLGRDPDSAGAYARHPLAYLVEAADDICYSVIDLEDAYKLKIIPYSTVEKLLGPFTTKLPQRRTATTDADQVARLRASAISAMISTCMETAEQNWDDFSAGVLPASLIDSSPLAALHKTLTDFEKENVYTDARVQQVEIAGFRALGGLFDFFAAALLAKNPNVLESKARSLFPADLLTDPGAASPEKRNDRTAAIDLLTPYQKLMAVADYVSGMTDSFAVELFQRLSGIKLPT